MRSSNETLIRALRILANDIKSDDGVAQAAIFEGAQRIEELMDRIKRLETRIKRLEKALLDEMEEKERIKRREQALLDELEEAGLL